MNSNPAPFSLKLSQTLGYSFSFIVLIMFLRNWLPFAVIYAPLVIALIAFTMFAMNQTFTLNFKHGSNEVGLSLAYRRPSFRLSLPRPTKSDVMPLLPCVIITLIAFLHFQAFPIFPQNLSADFSQHANLLRAISSNQSFPLTAQILKFGYLYILALPLSFSSMTLASPVPLLEIRAEMAVMAILSPYFFYLTAYRLFDSHRIAWMTALLWALLGYGWFGMVFNSGLYSNFYGGLASLFLIAAAKDFMTKKAGVFRLFLLALALTNAYLSHYTSLSVIPIVVAYMIVLAKRERGFKRGIVGTLALIAPMGLGLFLFKGLVSDLLALFSANANSSPFITSHAPTFLPKPLYNILPNPFFANMAYLFSNDYFTLGAFLLLAVFGYMAFAQRRLPLLILLAWFALIATASSLNLSAWRLAFFSFITITPMLGFLFGRMIERKKQSFVRQAILVVCFGFLLFNSWSTHAVGDSFIQGSEGATAQIADYRAIEWIKDNVPSNESLLSVSDANFAYSPYLASRDVRFDLSGLAAPEIASGLASQLDTPYIIVTNQIVGAQPFMCTYPFGLSLSTNASQVKAGGIVPFRLSVAIYDPQNLKQENGSAAVWGNGHQLGTVNLTRGVANFSAVLPAHGNYTFVAIMGSESTEPLTLLSTSNPHPRWIQSQPSQTPTSCYPWFTFTWQRLGCHTPQCLVYSDDFVKIWKVKGT